jgi:gag-polyprotein putative aspartyl protease
VPETLDPESSNRDDMRVISTVSFDRVQHLVRVPVELAGDRHRFLVDTGIGVTVVSSAVAARHDVRWTGETFTAQRMSGQVLQSPLVRLPPLKLGKYAVDAHIACVADLGDVDGPAGFAGILGPGFFENHVTTTDPDAMSFTVQPSASFQKDNGYEIPLEMRRHDVSVDPFARLVLPSGREVCVEVDTGSRNLILDTRFMPDCGVRIESPGVLTKIGTDETGYQWTRRWATVSGEVYFAAAPETAQAGARVQFQGIIYDGLVGTDYLERYRVTFDVSGSRLVLSPRGQAGR